MFSDSATARYTGGFIALTVICYLGILVWPDFMAAMGAGHAGVWFLDINTLLASNDAVTRGLNPYLPNPLDYTRDAHAYSDWWLQLRHLGLGRKDRLWLGAAIDCLFFLAIFRRVRARSFREMLVLWLLVFSPPFILGFNRANPDLLIYALLAPVTALLLSRRWAAQALGYGLVTLAIGLKYYPVIACGIVLFTARSRAELGRLVMAWVLVGLVLAWNLHDDVARSSGLMTATAGFYTFGAAALAANLGHGLLVLTLGLLLALGAFAWGWWRPVFSAESTDDRSRAEFVLGAGLVVACFFLTISYTYRLIFMLMTVPWLWQLTRTQSRRSRGYGWAVLGLSLVLLWWDGAAALLINMNLDVIAGPSLSAVLNGVIIGGHCLGWAWVGLWLAGLGTMGRFIWLRWSVGKPAHGIFIDSNTSP
jgi:hypothetical protein